MEFLRIDINIELIISTVGKLKNQSLKTSLYNYSEAMTQIVADLSTPHIFTVYGLMRAKERFFSKEQVDVLLELFEKIKSDPEATVSDIIEHLKQASKRNVREVSQNAIDELEKLDDKFPEIQKVYRSIGLNSLINCWTLFEAFSKEAWVYCLNNHPKSYIHNVLKYKSESDNNIDGILGKNISISFLAKYNFDISKELGDILSAKYDFTGVRGMKKAFGDLLQNDFDNRTFDSSDLNQLEITRHLLVHNAGIIDNNYLRRSTRKGEVLKEPVRISADHLTELINSSIEILSKLYLIVDAHLESH